MPEGARMMCEAELTQLYEGTSEIQKLSNSRASAKV